MFVPFDAREVLAWTGGDTHAQGLPCVKDEWGTRLLCYKGWCRPVHTPFFQGRHLGVNGVCCQDRS